MEADRWPVPCIGRLIGREVEGWLPMPHWTVFQLETPSISTRLSLAQARCIFRAKILYLGGGDRDE